MTEKQLDDHTVEQVKLIVSELNNLQTSFDTRLLATLLADRAAYLHGLLVKMGHMTKEEAQNFWAYASNHIENPPEQEVKTMNLVDGEIFDPEKVN